MANSSLEFSQIFAEWYVCVLLCDSEHSSSEKRNFKNKKPFYRIEIMLGFFHVTYSETFSVFSHVSDVKLVLMKAKSAMSLTCRSNQGRRSQKAKILLSQHFQNQ